MAGSEMQLGCIATRYATRYGHYWNSPRAPTGHRLISALERPETTEESGDA